jgi:hypothetical protein
MQCTRTSLFPMPCRVGSFGEMQAPQLTRSSDSPVQPLKPTRPPRASFSGMTGGSGPLTSDLAGEPARPEGR